MTIESLEHAKPRWDLFGAKLKTEKAFVASLDLTGALPVSTGKNDEVAAILRGLHLDKDFFKSRLQPEVLLSLQSVGGGNHSPKNGSSRQDQEVSTGCRMKRHLNATKAADFDIYLNQALMPVLAQALDSLCRQLTRMDNRGEAMDTKVRSRFNPITWLAQQMLRLHPKYAKTPRRMQIYSNFALWGDQERGRREILRRKQATKQVFDGFVLRDKVQKHTVMQVISAIDETFRLKGVLKDNAEIVATWEHYSQAHMKNKADITKRGLHLFEGEGVTFEEFWQSFSKLVVQYDIVPYSVIEEGLHELQVQADAVAQRVKAEIQLKLERQQNEELQNRLAEEYAGLYTELSEDQQLNSIIKDNKTLTGYFWRPGEAAFEFEAAPAGDHVRKLSALLALLGFEGLLDYNSKGPMEDEQKKRIFKKDLVLRRGVTKQKFFANDVHQEHWWTEDHMQAWIVLQGMFRHKTNDGIVNSEILSQIIVPPSEFITLRLQVQDEVQSLADGSVKKSSHLAHQFKNAATRKATFEELALQLGLTVPRVRWLHHLFEGFLPVVEEGVVPTCGYPSHPAELKKAEFQVLFQEIVRGASHAEFEARFRRIDEDGSGVIEFDEFARWVHFQDIKLVGAGSVKKTFEELAEQLKEPLELVMYMHNCFQDQLPDGVVDQYPTDCGALPKEDTRRLLDILTGTTSDEFETTWQLLGAAAKKGAVDFDEFVELVEFDKLPLELRIKYKHQSHK